MLKKILSVLFSSLFLFTSCSDFLNGSELKSEIDQKITYTNATGSTVRFYCDSSAGSIYPSEDTEIKKNYAIELSFEPNATFDDNYVFSGWICTDSKGTPVNDCIDFDVDSKNPYKATAKLVKTADGLTIRAKTSLLPKITASSPKNEETGVVSNSTFTLVFNKDM